METRMEGENTRIILELRGRNDQGDERPAIVPVGFRSAEHRGSDFALRLWLGQQDSAAAGTILAVFALLAADQRFATMVRHAVEQLGERPVLVLARACPLQAGYARVESSDGLYEGLVAVGQSEVPAFAREPDDYQSLWWWMIGSPVDELIVKLGHKWYAAVMQRIEGLLGFRPRREARPQEWQLPYLQVVAGDPAR